MEMRLGRTEVKASGSPIGLLARYHLSADMTLTASTDARINFDAMDYDPLNLVVTGASWHLTIPEDGWYQCVLTQGFIDANGATWAAATGCEIYIKINGSLPNDGWLGYEESDGTSATHHWLFLTGSRAGSFSIGDTIDVFAGNFSASDRKLSSDTGIEFYRVA